MPHLALQRMLLPGVDVKTMNSGKVKSGLGKDALAQGGFDALATVTVAAATTSSAITFAGIPQTYKNLKVIGKVRTDRTGSGYDWFTVRFNEDAGSNYSFHISMGQGTASYTYGTGSATSSYVGALTQASLGADFYGVSLTDIIEYNSNSKNKTIKTFYGHEANTGNTESHVGTISGAWYNTNPISSMTFLPPSGYNFSAGTKFELYGVK